MDKGCHAVICTLYLTRGVVCPTASRSARWRIMRSRGEVSVTRIMLRSLRVEVQSEGKDIAAGSPGVLQLGMLEVLTEYEGALDGERIATA